MPSWQDSLQQSGQSWCWDRVFILWPLHLAMQKGGGRGKPQDSGKPSSGKSVGNMQTVFELQPLPTPFRQAAWSCRLSQHLGRMLRLAAMTVSSGCSNNKSHFCVHLPPQKARPPRKQHALRFGFLHNPPESSPAAQQPQLTLADRAMSTGLLFKEAITRKDTARQLSIQPSGSPSYPGSSFSTRHVHP